jgi:citrate synthase
MGPPELVRKELLFGFRPAEQPRDSPTVHQSRRWRVSGVTRSSGAGYIYSLRSNVGTAPGSSKLSGGSGSEADGDRICCYGRLSRGTGFLCPASRVSHRRYPSSFTDCTWYSIVCLNYIFVPRDDRRVTMTPDEESGGDRNTTGAFNPGLEGVEVAETALSSIDGEAGKLTIRGFPVDELAPNATYEEAVFLLLNGRLPTADELDEFRADLAGRREVGPEVRGILRRAAEEEEPAMDAIRMGVAAATLGTDESDTAQHVRRVIAVLPTIVAAYWRYRRGADPIEPREELSHAENYLYMLSGDVPSESRARGLETYLNTVIDHGLNASTFSARVVVSTESDVVSAATAAVGTLKGPLHGGAPGPVLEMLQTVHETGDPRRYVRETLEAGDRLMGFGHRVYRVRDPRAAVLESAAEQFYGSSADTQLFETAREFESIATEMLADQVPNRRLETNVEFYTAILLDGVGVPKALFTPTFAISRAGGWMAHALEQLDDNRLIRPSSRYVGDTGRTWVPRDAR